MVGQVCQADKVLCLWFADIDIMTTDLLGQSGQSSVRVFHIE